MFEEASDANMIMTTKLSPKQCGAAGNTFQSLLLAIANGDSIKLQAFVDDPKSPFRQVVVKEFTKFEKFALPGNEFLKLLSAGDYPVIAATNGKDTLTKAGNVFSWIDGDFKNYGTDVASKPTGEVPVAIYEMAKDADFRTMFGSFGIDIRKLCLSQSQIKSFVTNHKNWLRTDGYATFFLFEVNGELFVARVDWYGGDRLGVHVRRFSRGRVWDAGYRLRVVVPQQDIDN